MRIFHHYKSEGKPDCQLSTMSDWIGLNLNSIVAFLYQKASNYDRVRDTREFSVTFVTIANAKSSNAVRINQKTYDNRKAKVVKHPFHV